MLEAFQDSFRKLRYFLVLLVNLIAFKCRDDFIVRLAVVNQAKSANRFRLQDNVAARDVMFGKNENIERVAVAVADLDSFGFFARETGNPLGAISLRNKPVVRRN